jgi:hypothetical protein
VADHRLGPRLILLLPQKGWFAPQMALAQGMVAAVVEVRFPEVVARTPVSSKPATGAAAAKSRMIASIGSNRREQSALKSASVPSLKLSQAKRSRMISARRSKGSSWYSPGRP